MARLPPATKSIVAGQETGRGSVRVGAIRLARGVVATRLGANAPSQNQVARLNSAEHTAMRKRR